MYFGVIESSTDLLEIPGWTAKGAECSVRQNTGGNYFVLIHIIAVFNTVKPRFTAANFFPQIGLNMHIVNKQNPHLPR